MKISCIQKFPVGFLKITENNGCLTEISYTKEENLVPPSSELLKKACRELEEYFSGKRQEFDLKIALEGTNFQKQVWRALMTIPYGEVRSYEEIAIMIEKPHACRAVGNANHHNPIVIVIPCHRVITKNGTIGGYGGGIENKKLLLELEESIRRN